LNKKLLTGAIVVLAAVILLLNIWKPSQNEETKGNSNTVKEETPLSNKTPGADLSQVQEGKPAPDFKLATLDGRSVKLSDYKGKKVILNFWATWCPPCKAEMPHMKNFYEHNKDKGIEILAVNLTNVDKGKDAVETFAKDYQLTFTIALDEEGTIGKQYQAFTIPTSYIIDSNGIISKKMIGPMDEEMMETLTKDIK
jgi:peroxiredoxin